MFGLVPRLFQDLRYSMRRALLFNFTRVCGILFATARKWSILPLRSARKMKKERGGRIFEVF